MEKIEAEKFLVSCHRQQQELLSSLLDKVEFGNIITRGCVASGSVWVPGIVFPFLQRSNGDLLF